MFKVQRTLLLLSLSVGLAFALDICENQINGVRLAHPADCSKFVVCENGKTDSIISCPLGLHFNRFKSVCDLRQRAACDIEFVNFANEQTNCSACCALFGCFVNPECPVTSTPDTPTPDTPTPDSPENPATPTNPPKPETPSTPETPSGNQCSNNLTVCAGKSDGSVSHVNGTCNQYIVCVGECANIMSCPNNLQYNLATQRCDYPENVNCPWQSTPPTTGPSGVTCAKPDKCAGQSDGTLFANPNDNGYIVCQCECEIERPCPAGTKFDEQLLTCARDESENGNSNGNGNENGNGNDNGSENGNESGNGNVTNADCANNTEICKNQTESSQFPVDGICNKFYKCSNGCAVEILCPNNLVYNPSAKHCDYPQNYKCPWPYTPPSGPSAGPSGIACPSGGRCVGQAEGTLLSSLNSCSKYVVCQCECEVEMNCANNLLWDNELSTCNYAANTTCSLP